nr:MBOAT family O-acyltransferase [Prochlorococcus marinus]
MFASYIFYSYWDWRFLSLIIVVSFQTFYFGKLIKLFIKNKKIYLISSILINLLILFFFKYFNFFSLEFANLFNLKNDLVLNKIILPVGISFYIFQSLTYVVDIYFGKINPEKNIINYFAYVSFFPQLVAGPIERASSLLPQFNKLHGVNLKSFYLGLKYIIIGLSFKIVIADSLASHVDKIFNRYYELSGGVLYLGAILFSIQIYCDFCGYSLVAIGVAKIINFNLSKNFDTPYFANSIKNFWRRWHISLSNFFKDYVYIPLGGSRSKTKLKRFRNIIITFTLSGVWHGANWTFLIWGFLNGFLLSMQNLFKVKLPNLISSILTLLLISFLWIIFRSLTIYDAFNYISRIFLEFQFPELSRDLIIILIYYFSIDYLLFKYKDTNQIWFNNLTIQNYILFSMLFILFLINKSQTNFIYFEF